MYRQKRVQAFLEFLIDLFCLIAANVLSIIVFMVLVPRIQTYEHIEWVRYGGTQLLAYLVIFFGFHFSLDIQTRSRRKEIMSLLQNAALIYGLFAVLIVLLKNPIIESRYMLISSFIFFVAFSAVGRYFLKRILTGFYKSSKIASMVGVITTSDRAEEFIEKVKADWSVNVTGIVLLDDLCYNDVFNYSEKIRAIYGSAPVNATTIKDYPDSVLDIPVISTDSSFMDWIRSAPLDEVIINLPYRDDSELQELVEELEDMGIMVHINIPALDDIMSESKFNNINCKMHYGLPMASFVAKEPIPALLTLKRLFDVVIGIIGCILSAPIIAIVAIPLLRESEGPLFFKQQRVGKNGRLFNIYKLRSMYVDAEERKAELLEKNNVDGFMFKMEDDPRVTKVGKFIRRTSIDELPQFFNVIKGDMSLVGTRPPTVDEFEQYESRHKRRLSMRPGITGMWQVSGRSDIQDFEEVVELDCRYIDEWSVSLDIKIMLKTVVVVFTGKGAK